MASAEHDNEKLNNICVQGKPTSAIDIVNNIDGYDSRV